MGYSADSFSAGEQPTTSKWNKLWSNDASFNDGTGIANLEIGSGHTSLKIDYKFYVYRSAALNSASSDTVIAMDTKAYDTGTNVDVVTNKGRFTAPVSGFYWLAANAGNSSATATFMSVSLFKNGVKTLVGNTINPPNAGTITSVAGVLQLSASDFIEPAFVGGGGSAMTVGQSSCYFMGFLVSQT